MCRYLRSSLTAAGCLLFAAALTQAATITIDFGTGAGVLSAWPGSATGANSNVGINLPSPLLLDAGELAITTSPGVLVCAASTSNSSRCASSGAYGLGVRGTQVPRIDPGELLTVTVTDDSYLVRLVGFGVTGFSSGEQGQYSIDGGSPTVFSAPLSSSTLPSPAAFTTLVWGVPSGNTGNYTLGSLTLDVEMRAADTPEPCSLGLAGLALAGLAATRRRKRVLTPTSRLL
jgi:MYXO-CTERM domain-containing protein